VNVEREAKLAVDTDFRLPDLSHLGAGLEGIGDVTERFVSSYHDTPDLRIVRWGASLRYRAAEGWTVKLPQGVQGSVTTRSEHAFDGGPGRAPAGAIDLVRGLVRDVAVGPVARLQTVRHHTRVACADDDHQVADVVVDDVSVLEGRRIVDRFREVEVEFAADADGSTMSAVLDALTDAGARATEPSPKVVRALGSPAMEPPDVVPLSIHASSTVAEVIRSTIAMSTIRLIRNDAAVRLGVDPEGVHQARVATRRLRSDLRTARSMLDRRWRRGLREELGWLGAELGRVRDLDVLGARLRAQASSLADEDAANVAKVLDRLRARRDAARAELLSAIRAPRYVALLDALVDAARAPLILDDVAGVRALDVMGVVMEKPWAELESHCDSLGPGSTDAELHEARIRAKRVRYAAEALTPVFGKPAKRFARRAESLQEVLGTHQDAVVAIAWLRDQAGGVTPRAAFTAGRLAGIEAAARDEARAAWPQAWSRLRRERLRFWE
jgi:CHAD domain-containing protein